MVDVLALSHGSEQVLVSAVLVLDLLQFAVVHSLLLLFKLLQIRVLQVALLLHELLLSGLGI
jgi:hypothetical protein